MSEPYWVPLGAAPVVEHGTELAYVESTAPVTITGATEAAPTTVVTAPSVVFDGSPVLLEFACAEWNLPVTATIAINFWEMSGTPVDLGHCFLGVTDGSGRLTGMGSAGPLRLTPSPGPHTYAVRASRTGVGTFVLKGGVGGAGQPLPGYIRITKV